MSTVTNQHNEENYVQNDYNLGKIFVYGNRTSQGTFKNNTGGAAAFSQGLVLARDSSDNTLVPLNPANTTNGANLPVGILFQDLAEVADAGTVTNVYFVTEGDVVEERVIFQAGDKNSVIAEGGARSVEDLLRDLTIKLIPSDALTGPDNS